MIRILLLLFFQKGQISSLHPLDWIYNLENISARLNGENYWQNMDLTSNSLPTSFQFSGKKNQLYFTITNLIFLIFILSDNILFSARFKIRLLCNRFVHLLYLEIQLQSSFYRWFKIWTFRMSKKSAKNSIYIRYLEFWWFSFPSSWLQIKATSTASNCTMNRLQLLYVVCNYYMSFVLLVNILCLGNNVEGSYIWIFFFLARCRHALFSPFPNHQLRYILTPYKM